MSMLTPDRMLRAMVRTPVILDAILQDVSPERAREARDGADGWSVVEVVGHLLDIEHVYFERARTMVDSDMPVLTPVDQDIWVRERGYATQDVQPLFQDYVRLRREFVAYLESLGEDDWQRQGVHPQAGVIDVTQTAMNASQHDVNHIEQIVRALGMSEPFERLAFSN